MTPVSPKKALGQHFLIDRTVLGVIERLAALEPDDVVLEIGPGLGVLTTFLADRVRFVHAIEIDRGLEPSLEDALEGRENVSLTFGDALALDAVTRAVDGAVFFEARIEKRVPVAGGLGGGSSDAAAALTLANSLLEQPLEADVLERLAGSLCADVPFFLLDGTQLGIDDGTTLLSIGLPRDYAVLLALPHGAVKASTADVYAAFDARRGDVGFDDRRAALLGALERLARAADLGHLPSNDLASSPLAPELRDLGAIRAGRIGVFPDRDAAERAAAALGHRASTWVATPA